MYNRSVSTNKGLTKIRMKDRLLEPSQGRQKGKAKERSKDIDTKNQKKARKLIPLMVQSYLTHGPSNVANMQIVRFNSNGRSRTSITYQHNIFFL
jgi:hypothetical protein